MTFSPAKSTFSEGRMHRSGVNRATKFSIERQIGTDIPDEMNSLLAPVIGLSLLLLMRNW